MPSAIDHVNRNVKASIKTWEPNLFSAYVKEGQTVETQGHPTTYTVASPAPTFRPMVRVVLRVLKRTI
jgi:hypothetical protein